MIFTFAKFWLRATMLLFIATVASQEKKSYKIQTVAFYNLENLYDIEDDPITYDDDRTPDGKDHWTAEVYQKKLKNMARVLADIGSEVTKNTPAIIGVAEIENRKVLEDLVNEPSLLSKDYGIVHFDSPDKRGIDVALLYQKSLFTPTHTSIHELVLYKDKEPTKRKFTRDQLLVSGYLDRDLVHIIVNHWPSRSGGEARSCHQRENAAALNMKIIDSLFDKDPYAKIITMGDLNDDPSNTSVKNILKAKSEKKQVMLRGLYNPMYKMARKGEGTLAYGDRWNLFDQIIISKALLKKEYTSYRYYKAGIFNKPYLITPSGKYKGYPFRSFANGQFTGGYSDHYPVYMYLIKEANQ